MSSIDWVAVQSALQTWVVGGSGLTDAQVYWAGQSKQRVAEPSICMMVHRHEEVGHPSLTPRVNTLTLATRTITAVSAGADTLTISAHGMLTGDGPVRVSSTGSLPAGLVANTDYWVIRVDANTFKLTRNFTWTGIDGVTTPVPVDLQGTGTGTISLAGTSATVRAGLEVVNVARTVYKLRLELTCFTSSAVGMGAVMSVLQRVAGRRGLPGQKAILRGANIGLNYCEHARAVRGTLDAVLFEPRAVMEVQLNLAGTEGELGTTIDRVQITDPLETDHLVPGP